MKRKKTPSPSSERYPALHEILRHGDPAGDGRAPGAEETRLLRARLLAEARDVGETAPAPRPAFRPALALAAVAGFVLLVAVAVLPLRRSRPESEGAGPVETAIGASAEAPRQVHFTTPGGTRIVWVLYPESR